jgi:hypothetical protein
LGSSKSIGKVALFARSDLQTAEGTGFPTAFQIQGSADKKTWSTLVTENNYPRVMAGEGQIFIFRQASARYIRIIASTLGGVASESLYRMQLGEVQVFA